MRVVLVLGLFLVAAAAPREGCGNGRAPPAYEPCAAKSCGMACTVCPPGAADCYETAVVKACDPWGRCVPEVDGMCAAQGACTAKTCGDECTIDPPCRFATPPCMMPSVLGHCSNDTECVAGPPPPCPPLSPPPPSWGCVGKACGDSCGFCPPGTDPANCPVPTLVATACDAQLQCVSVYNVTACPPRAACLHKPCGAVCDTCPACAGPGPAAEYCDASGACTAGVPSCPP